MNIDKLKAFYNVARLGSLERAAEELECGVATIIDQVSDLEKELKGTFFTRKGLNWSLTPNGQILCRKARTILSEIESTRRLVTDDIQSPSGVLRIVMTKNLAALWAPQFLKDFTDEHPDIRLRITSDDSELDVALGKTDIMIRPMIEPSDDIVQEYLMTWHVGLYASYKYIERFGTPKTIQDLDQHRLLSLNPSRTPAYHQAYWYLTFGKMNNEPPRDPFMSIDSLPALIDCVVQGMGITALSAELPIIKQGRLIQVLPEIVGPQVDIYYIYSRALYKSPRVRLFGEYLREHAQVDILPRPRVFLS